MTHNYKLPHPLGLESNSKDSTMSTHSSIVGKLIENLRKSFKMIFIDVLVDGFWWSIDKMLV